VWNSLGFAISSNAFLTITNSPPQITGQPTNQTVLLGATASFGVTAIGSPPLRYFWNFSGTNLPGATNSSLTLTNVQLWQAGNYFVRITNSVGAATSSIAVLTVSNGATGPPFITVQPNHRFVGVGSNATFSVTASGSPPLSYQWRFSNANIPGATTTSLLLTNVQGSNAGAYYVVVSNSLGFALSSNALLTFTNGPPEITVQPTNQVVGVGSNVAFYVLAGGAAPLSYQWRFSNTDIPGATRYSLLLTNVQASDAGVYYVVVSNSLGIALSSNAVLTLNFQPSAAPFLSGSLLGQNLVLSWPLWASNFTLLESSTAADSSDMWSNAPFEPFINSNGENAVTIPADADMKFYRLREP
jgi:hypothetical protein